MRAIAVVLVVMEVWWMAGCQSQTGQIRGVESPGDRDQSVGVHGDEDAIIERAERLGRMLYIRDDAAAKATDLLISQGVDFIEADSKGWITECQEDSCIVTYVTGKPQQWQSFCVVEFKAGEDPNVYFSNKDLTETQSAMFEAKQRAFEAIDKPCSKAYNTVVIPRDDESGWLAYALAATTIPDALVVGGHYRVTVSEDGQTILVKRRFTKSCLVLSTHPEDMPPDTKLAALTLTHLLDNTPTEIHVWLNLQCGLPLYVGTPDRRMWRIEDGSIQFVSRLKK